LAGGVYHVNTGAGVVHDEPFEVAGIRPRTKASFTPAAPGGGGFTVAEVETVSEETPGSFMQLWWNSIDMSAPPGTPLPPVVSELLAPEAVPLLIQPEDGIAIRVLAGIYRDSGNPMPSVGPTILLLHIRLQPGMEGRLGPIPHEYNGFAWVLEGSARVGGDTEEQGIDITGPASTGLALLPPGGDQIQIRHLPLEADPAAACELFIGLGLPHRADYVKYVGYGGGLIHRTVEEVEAAMAEYESDPLGYGLQAAGKGEQTLDLSFVEPVSGFMDNGGDPMERPTEARARFKYCVPVGKGNQFYYKEGGKGGGKGGQ